MMARKNPSASSSPGTHGRTVVGLFHDRGDAEDAIRDLKSAGFTEQQIGVAMQDGSAQQDLIEQTGSTAAEGAAKGAVSGGVVGGLIGLLGSLLIPGVGPIVVGGVLASTLTGAGIGAATGGIIGALVGIGVPEADAHHFDEGLRSGGILVTVDAGERVGEALAILEQHDVDLGPSNAAHFRGDAFAGTSATGETGDTERLQLREEQLTVDKHAVQAGEVRVRKEVITEQRTIDVPVSREEVVIERHAAADPSATSGAIGDDEEIRIPLMEEQVEVDKRPVVREELEVGKRRVQETRQVSDAVRREEARVETEGRRGRTGANPYKGKERRRRADAAYAGPERRMATL